MGRNNNKNSFWKELKSFVFDALSDVIVPIIAKVILFPFKVLLNLFSHLN